LLPGDDMSSLKLTAFVIGVLWVIIVVGYYTISYIWAPSLVSIIERKEENIVILEEKYGTVAK
jgi:hypothetical protein